MIWYNRMKYDQAWYHMILFTFINMIKYEMRWYEMG